MINLTEPTCVEVKALLYNCPVLIRIHLDAPDSVPYSVSTEIPGLGMNSIVYNVEFFYVGFCSGKSTGVGDSIKRVEKDLNRKAVKDEIQRQMFMWQKEVRHVLNFIGMEEQDELVQKAL